MSTAYLCWTCADVHTAAAPCLREQNPALPQADDYFTLFGLPCALLIDPDDLRERFYERSRRLHPDRFAQRSGDELAAATQGSAALNQGYRTLRDPLIRASHRLSMLGSAPAEKGPNPALLMELMETEEQIDEVRGSQPTAAQRSELEGALAAYRARVAELDADLTRLFAEHDRVLADPGAPSPPAQAEALAPITAALQANLGVRKYYRNIIRNLDEVLEA